MLGIGGHMKGIGVGRDPLYGWVLSRCPVCGKQYPHKEDYKPVTCGKFDCLHEAKRRGLLDGKR